MWQGLISLFHRFPIQELKNVDVYFRVVTHPDIDHTLRSKLLSSGKGVVPWALGPSCNFGMGVGWFVCDKWWEGEGGR